MNDEYYTEQAHNFRTTKPPTTRQTVTKLGEDFLRDLRSLFTQQSRLLQQELKEKAQVVKTSSMTVSIGAALLLIALQTFVAAAVFGLAMVMPWWGSALLVGLIVLALGAAMVGMGAKRMDADHLKPKKSLETFDQMNAKFREKVHEYKKQKRAH